MCTLKNGSCHIFLTGGKIKRKVQYIKLCSHKPKEEPAFLFRKSFLSSLHDNKYTMGGTTLFFSYRYVSPFLSSKSLFKCVYKMIYSTCGWVWIGCKGGGLIFTQEDKSDKKICDYEATWGKSQPKFSKSCAPQFFSPSSIPFFRTQLRHENPSRKPLLSQVGRNNGEINQFT